MAQVGDSAYTDHGPGVVTAVDNLGRGGKQFRVAGRGFDVWVPEIRLRLASGDYIAGLETTIEQGDTNDDNSTTLPYDPSPQYPVDLFSKEQTILPGDHEIDPDDRLHPSDSLTKNRADANRPYPGPSPDLFAKGAAHGDPYAEFFGPGPDKYHDYIDHEHGHGYLSDEDAHSGHRDVDKHFGHRRHAEEEPFQGDPYKEWGDDEWHSDLPDGPERTFDAGRHEWDPEVEGELGPGEAPSSLHILDREKYERQGPAGRHRAEGAYRPAGLSNRYAHIIEPDDERDPITAFRRDPVEFMQRRAYVLTAGEEDHLYKKFADYDNLLEVEASQVGGFDKTAAWSDVRQKAQRLRREGRVHVNHVTPQHIYATVNGDSGTYDTMIVKGASGAFSGGQSIANWSCDCEWGKWAFQRKVSYVGRLCSHAYAAYLDMQSHTHKDNGGRFKAASIVDDFKSWAKENNDGHTDRGSMTDFINTCEKRVTKEEADQLYDYLNKNIQVAPERDYDIPYTFDNEEAYKKTADALRQRPLSLTPDLRQVPKDDENKWTDVTEDDRETTGPEQIVHFSSLASKLHTADAWPSINDWVGDAGSALVNNIGKGFDTHGHGWRGLVDSQFGDDSGHGFLETHGPLGSDPTGQQAEPAGAVAPANASQHSMDLGKGGVGVVNADGTHSAIPDAQLPGVIKDIKNEFQPGGAPPGGAGPAAPPGAKPTNPTWFPKQESTTTNLDPNSPWTPNQNKSDLKGNSYQIQRGDTLNDIAQRSGLQVNDIAKANNIQDINKINAGDTLKLPGENRTPTSGGTLPSEDTFKTLNDQADKDAGGTAPMAGTLPSEKDFNTLNTQADKPPASPGASGPKDAVGAPPAPPAAPKPPTVPGLNDKGVQGLKPQASLAYRLHHATDDDDNDDDERRPDTGEAAAKLDRLRALSEEDQSDHYQDMDSYNQEIRDLVEDLNEAGVDAMPFVASRFAAPQGQRKDNDPSDGDANFAGQSNPNWADEPFNGSGPDPQLWYSDSASYIDEHERPDFDDVTDLPDGDIIKFNDSRSAPQQGPRHGSRRRYADGDDVVGDGTGYFNSDNPSREDWEEGSGEPFMNEVGHAADQMNPLHGMSDGGEEGGEGGSALAEEAPELLALASRSPAGGGFSLEAFDRGEFSFDDGPGGELRHANRVGGGPTQSVRIDPGGRGHKKQSETYSPPEDFGNNGDPDLAAYSGGGDGADASGGDVLASFQRSAGALEMMHGGQQVRAGSLDDFSSSPMVQSMLRTAGRNFSPEEQRMLEAEAHPMGARNLPTDEDLAGTHYLL